jgi:hypothetical protein
MAYGDYLGYTKNRVKSMGLNTLKSEYETLRKKQMLNYVTDYSLDRTFKTPSDISYDEAKKLYLNTKNKFTSLPGDRQDAFLKSHPPKRSRNDYPGKDVEFREPALRASQPAEPSMPEQVPQAPPQAPLVTSAPTPDVPPQVLPKPGSLRPQRPSKFSTAQPNTRNIPRQGDTPMMDEPDQPAPLEPALHAAPEQIEIPRQLSS